MAERAPLQPERDKSHENHHHKAEQHEKLKETAEAGEKAEQKAKDSLETIRSNIDKEATKTAARKHEHDKDEADDQGPGQVVIDRNVKKKAYKKELHKVQSHLPKAQRSFSKFIHSGPVEAISEVGGKTVARPSGLLGGGLVAFLGTAALVLTSRHYGFTYNYFVFIALLIGGFFLGLVAEMIVRSLFKARS